MNNKKRNYKLNILTNAIYKKEIERKKVWWLK